MAPDNSLTWLNLEENEIRLIENGAFDKLVNLKGIYLSGNRLQAVTEGVFGCLINLNHLHLGNNDIAYVEDEAVSKMADVTYMNLMGNRLRTISAQLANSISRMYITAENNPLRCNCELKMLREALEKMSHKWLGKTVTCSTWRRDEVMFVDEFVHLDLTCRKPSSPMMSMVVKDNSSVTVTCSSDGDPAPTIRLIDTTGEIWDFHPQQNHSSSTNVGEIHVLMKGGFGNFACEAINVAGVEWMSLEFRLPGEGHLRLVNQSTTPLNGGNSMKTFPMNLIVLAIAHMCFMIIRWLAGMNCGI